LPPFLGPFQALQGHFAEAVGQAGAAHRGRHHGPGFASQAESEVASQAAFGYQGPDFARVLNQRAFAEVISAAFRGAGLRGIRGA